MLLNCALEKVNELLVVSSLRTRACSMCSKLFIGDWGITGGEFNKGWSLSWVQYLELDQHYKLYL